MSGKGSNRRPQQVSEAEMAERWERTFGGGRLPLRHLTVEEMGEVLEADDAHFWATNGLRCRITGITSK